MNSKKTGKRVPIRRVFAYLYVVLTFVTVFASGGLIFIRWISCSNEATKWYAATTNSEIVRRIESFLHNPLRINQINEKLIMYQLVDLTDQTKRERYFANVVQFYDEDIYSFSYGTETGEYYGARINEYGITEIMRNNAETSGHTWYYSVNEDLTAGERILDAKDYDPRTRDWYQTAKSTGELTFSPVYKHFVVPDLAVSVSTPIYDHNHELQGVLGTHMILSSIDRMLKDVIRDRHGFALIVEKETGALIANSLGIPNFQENHDGSIFRTQINHVDNDAVIDAFHHYSSTHEQHFNINTKKGIYWVDIEECHENGIDWLVAAAVPTEAYNYDIYSSMQTAFHLALVFSFLSIVIYYVFSKKFYSPFDRAITAMGSLAAGNFSERVPEDKKNGIDRISNTFNSMADKIQQEINHLKGENRATHDALRRATVERKAQQELLRMVLDAASDAIFGIDLDGNCIFCNAICLNLLRYRSEDELLGKNMHALIHHSKKDGTPIREEDCEMMQAVKRGVQAYQNNEVFWRADGTHCHVEYFTNPTYIDGQLSGAVMTFKLDDRAYADDGADIDCADIEDDTDIEDDADIEDDVDMDDCNYIEDDADSDDNMQSYQCSDDTHFPRT